MPDLYCELSNTKFVPYTMGGREVLVPDFLANRHPHRSTWELARFDSMEKYLRPGLTLFDIGAEQGYMSAILARFIGGGENMVLMEPVPNVWPNIKATWEANGLRVPRATFCGFVSDRSWTADFHDFPIGYKDGWPNCAYSDQLLDSTKFRYTTEHAHVTDSITIDQFVDDTQIVPDAVNIDVEGFEISVIRGAIKTLTQCPVMVWLSLHDANNIYDRATGGQSIVETRELMNKLGYREEYIATDHESHFRYWRD